MRFHDLGRRRPGVERSRIGPTGIEWTASPRVPILWAAPAAGPFPQTQTEPPMPETLARPQDDRMIAGVVAGLADRFGVDPGRARIAYVLLSVLSAGFPGILVYLLLWFLMPSGD